MTRLQESTQGMGWRSLLPIMNRRVRRDVVALLLVSAVVVLTSGLLSGVPLFLDDTSTRGLRHALETAHPAQAGVRITQYFDNPSGEAGSWLAETADSMGVNLPGLLDIDTDRRDLVVDTADFDWYPTQPDAERQPVVTNLRVQPGVAGHAQVLEGRLPTTISEFTDVAPELLEIMPPTAGVDEESLTNLPVVEVAIAEDPATELELAVGDEMLLVPEATTFAVTQGRGDGLMVARLVGILGLDPVTDPYWFGDASLHDTGVIENARGDRVTLTTLLAHQSEVTRSMYMQPEPLRMEVRIPTDADALADAGHGAVQDAVAELRQNYLETPAYNADPAASTGLDDLVEEQLGQRRVAYTIMSVAGIGILVMTAAAALVISGFLARKRRWETANLRSRGTTSGQLLLLAVIEAALVAVPAAFLGWWVAVSVVEGGQTTTSVWIALVVAITAAGSMVAATITDIRRDLNDLVSTREETETPSRTRLISEIVVVVLAVIGIVGLTGRASPTDPATSPFDPVVLGVPVLVALATGVVVLRLYRYPLELLGRVTQRLRGLVVVTALQRVERNPTATALPMLILVLGVATTVFAVIVVTSISAGQEAAAWQQVGADARLIATEADITLEDTASRGAVAKAEAIRDTMFVSGERINSGRVTGLLLDPSGYAEVTEGTPLPALPRAFFEEVDEVAPIILSDTEISGYRPAVGDRFNIRFSGQAVDVEVVALRDDFPAMSDEGAWLIASRDHMETLEDTQLATNELLLREPDPTALEELPDGVEALSRRRILDGFQDTPLVAGTNTAFSVLSAYSALLVTLTIGAALVMAGRARRRDLGFLRTLGMSRRQMASTVAIELVIPTLTGVVLGIGTGIFAARITTPTIDLSSFYADAIPTILSVDILIMVAVGLGALALMLLAATMVVILMRNEAALDVLRVGET